MLIHTYFEKITYRLGLSDHKPPNVEVCKVARNNAQHHNSFPYILSCSIWILLDISLMIIVAIIMIITTAIIHSSDF